MITFKNTQNINIYTNFINELEDILRGLYSEQTIIIQGINMDHHLAIAVSDGKDPFATNKDITKPLLILVNDTLCNSLGLMPGECNAMILHEMGHLMDSTPREGNEELRETNADRFAVNLGFTQELKSGLKKLIADDRFSEEAEMMKKRVEILSN